VERLNAEFNIYQHYYSESILSSKSNIKERIGRLNNVAAFNETALMQLEALSERLENDEVKLFIQNWNIQIFADSLEELNNKALEIQTLVERRNLLLMRETKNLEACFWSIFPTWEHYRVRKYQITSDNLAHFITFSSDNSGLYTNSWGDKPVAKFLTNDNSVYNFSFHKTSEKLALGNTVVIGAPGKGKTTLISFLLSQAKKYENFKAMIFDRGYGFKIFADVIGANYSDFSGSLQNINPLQLPEKDKIFLQNWLENLLKRKSDEDKEIIANALEQIYQLKKNDRTLENIATSFGKRGTGSIRNALDVWLKKGANGAYFNSTKDALDFDNDFTFFDTTILLDNPDVLGAIADYLFFRMKSTILNSPSPSAICIDEANKYLASEQFSPKIKETSEECRKLDMILILMLQTAGSLFENEMFQKMKENFSTYILFPNHKAEAKYYIDEIGLNSAEFNWIKTASSREVMIKKEDAETVILNVDLSSLGKYLKVFNSSSKDVSKVNELQKENSEEWLDIYLNGEKNV
jgi:type IV secretion/conjugal transfer VirB4 family ATPase